jgi:hypothetical protein
MKTSQIVIGIVILVIVIGLAGWYAYSNPQIATALGLRPAPAMQTNTLGVASSTPRRFGGMRGGFTTGSIEVLNGNAFTITLANGTTKVVNLTATTTIENYASASSTPTMITLDQLSVGEQVSVIGSPDSDDSITARTVRTGVVPTMGQGRGGDGQFNNGPHTGANGGVVPPPTAAN